MRYEALLRHVPLAMQEQTRRFAEHVARAHRWYKHVPPMPPGVLFVFSLDPNADRLWTIVDGRMISSHGQSPAHHANPTFKDITDRKDVWHYKMMTSAEYRQ